jgi:thiol-disulfide isomerase/thioredoxin
MEVKYINRGNMICNICKKEKQCDKIWKYSTETTNCEEYKQNKRKTMKVLLMLFGSEGCVYCPSAERAVKSAITKINKDNVTYVKKDRDKDRGMAIKYSIASVPAFVLLVNGEIRQSFVGLKTEKDILSIIEKELNNE